MCMDLAVSKFETESWIMDSEIKSSLSSNHDPPSGDSVLMLSGLGDFCSVSAMTYIFKNEQDS